MALDREIGAEEQVGDGQEQGLGQGPSILIIVLPLLGTQHPGATSVVAGQGEVAPGLGGGRACSGPRQALWAVIKWQEKEKEADSQSPQMSQGRRGHSGEPAWEQ